MSFEQYVSKPVAISAMRYDGFPFELDRTCMRLANKPIFADETDRYVLEVKTISGQWVEVPVGYYIIKEQHGDGYYPCHPAHFNERYMQIPAKDET